MGFDLATALAQVNNSNTAFEEDAYLLGYVDFDCRNQLSDQDVKSIINGYPLEEEVVAGI